MASSSPVSVPFLLLFRNCGPDTHAHLSAEGRAELTERWNGWFEGLVAQGKAQHGRPLALDGRVVAGVGGKQVVTDGPFAETKEVLGGYVYLTVANLDEATAIARQCPGLAVGLTVEIREVVSASPALAGVTGRGP